MCVEVHPPVKGLAQEKAGLSSAVMAAQVKAARQIQEERFRGTGIMFNSQMTGDMVKMYCFSSPEAAAYAAHLAEQMDLTMRAQYKLLKVARTLADLDGSEPVLERHMDEAVCYRMVEQSYWDF